MTTITYAPVLTPIFAETVIESSLDLSKSDFYLEKKDGFLNLNIEILENNNEYTSQIFDIKKVRKGYKLSTNTTNIIGTNIRDDNGLYYYYKIISNQILKDEDIDHYNFYFYNGDYYINEEIPLIEIRENLFIHTEYIFNANNIYTNLTSKFTAKHIELYFDTEETFVFKPKTTIVCEPQILNENTVIFPSFYLKNKKYIEGDVRIIEKNEYRNTNGNFIYPKDKIVENLSTNTTENLSRNIIILKDTFLNSELYNIKYTAKISSHTFDVEEISYFKLTPYMLERGTPSDYTFKIIKTVNKNYLKLYNNNYKNEYLKRNRPQDFLFYVDEKPSERDSVSFKKYISNILKYYPSTTPYVISNNSKYYQHNNHISIPEIYKSNTNKNLEHISQSINTNHNYIHFSDYNVTYFNLVNINNT